MNPIIRGGLLLGVLCGIWMFVVGLAGWYRDTVMVNMFYLVIVFQLGVLVRVLKQTAAAGNGYGGQVGAGTLMSLVAGVVIIASSLIFTTVAFPNYFEEIRAIQAEMMRAEGVSDEAIAAQLDLAAQMQTPVINALMGFAGTMVTGLVGSLLIGAFIRKK